MYELPPLEATDRFTPLRAFGGARPAAGRGDRTSVGTGATVTAIRAAVPAFRAEVIASGSPTGVATCDLVTAPQPAGSVLWDAAGVRTPYVWLTSRMYVVQWEEDRRTRTLLWQPTDLERRQHTAAIARWSRERPLPEGSLTTVHGTVLGHLRALGIDPLDVDLVAFDHLHGQDVRRLVGTTRPAPDLGATDRPVPPWFPNATLLVPLAEWQAVRTPHALQSRWYQPATFADLPRERIAGIDGDVLIGPGVALLAAPGHTAGTTSLVLHTDAGLTVVSANGVAADAWAPRSSRIRGVQRAAADRGLEVLPGAGVASSAADQYDAMVAEALVADPTPGGLFPRCVPARELTPHPLAPGASPTYEHGGVTHGRVRSRAVLTGVRP